MFDDDFFDEWLNEEIRRVQGKIKAGQVLDADDKVLLILKGQVNHFHHLDIDLRGEIKTLREDMGQRFQQVDGRFEAIGKEMERRFEQVDSRFEKMGEELESRFAQVDKRFAQVDGRFEQVDKRFEQVDGRLEKMEKRFEEMGKENGKRFDQNQEESRKLYQAINSQTWKMIGAIGLIVILARLAGGVPGIIGGP